MSSSESLALCIWYSEAGTSGFGITILSLDTFPDIGDFVTTSVPSLAMLVSLKYLHISFQYSPPCFPAAFGGSFPEVAIS